MTLLDNLTDQQISQYTRDMLMAAREYVLIVKRTAKQGGFGQVSGRMIREAVGYKFDSMPVDSVLKAMSTADFLQTYTAKLTAWYNGLAKSATESTLKRNSSLFAAAKCLGDDTVSFNRLITALRILCLRNQSWQESGNNVAIAYNGHRALLDLFGVNVTNTRRLSMSAV